jgi:molybdopterin-guanine dinucleotide biosynthesis protein A
VTGKNNDDAAVRGYVLAGGASRRFGADKALVEIHGRTLLSRLCELVSQAVGSAQVVAPLGRYLDQNVKLVPDRWPDEGPLGGIITALRTTVESGAVCKWNLILSCDLPFLTREWLTYLTVHARDSAADVVVPRSDYGLEPLCACWRTTATHSLQATFAEGVRKVTDAMKRLRMEILDETHWKRFDSAGRLFWNMNTPQEYEEALRISRAGEK